ncbi:MAG: caspase family protein [Myxococcales bacterium]|nr:caspase family protein [Myxococcales bacterium]
MTTRGLLIAIEDYRGDAPLAPRIHGAVASAQAVREWLLTAKGAQDVVFCASSPQHVPGATHGTTPEAVRDALAAIVDHGRNDTDELYVFFAGHGLSYRERAWTALVDVLVTSDFRSYADGRPCLQLAELREKLRVALGPGNHYWFIDACRTEVDADLLSVPDSGWTFGVSDLGFADVYTLQATSPGETALNTTEFSDALLAGLRGRGRSKVRDGVGYAVTFDRLRHYLRGRFPGADAETEGNGDGLIHRFTDTPLSLCRIAVEGANPGDTFQLRFSDGLVAVGAPVEFTGGLHEQAIPPNDYVVTLTTGTLRARQVQPPGNPVDLWDSATITFQRPSLPDGAPSLEWLARLDIVGPAVAGTQIRVLGANCEFAATDPRVLALVPGAYTVELIEAGGLVDVRHVDLLAHGRARVDFVRRAHRPVYSAILNNLPGVARSDGSLRFSDALEPTLHHDLGLWLALLAGSRIVEPARNHAALTALPLARFEGIVDAAHGALYVLGAGEDFPFTAAVGWPSRELADVLGEAPGTAAHAAITCPMQHVGVHHAVLELPVGAAGPYVVELLRDGVGDLRLATCVLPGRVTLVIVTQDPHAPLKIRQLSLPMHHLPHPPPDLAPLQQVQQAIEAQSRFLERRPAGAVGRGSAALYWQALVAGSRFDPFMCALAGYELRRRGDQRGVAALLRRVERDLAAVPDFAALCRLTGHSSDVPSGPPLFRDGRLVFPLAGQHGSAYQPDHTSPWSVWLRTRRPT